MPVSRATGVAIHYECAGDGPPMVLIHANPFDHGLWLYQVAHFSTWFRVIAVDIRGYGRSDKVTEPYTLNDMCDDVLGVMDKEDVDKAVLMGCSVGSSIAILLGLDHPERFEGLVLVGGNSGPSERFRSRIEGYTTDLPGYHLKHMRQLVAPGFGDTERGRYLLNMWVEREPRLDGEAIACVFRAGNGTDTTPRLMEMRVPTLVINGEHDHSLPAGQRTAALIPNAQHEVLAGTGHACCLEDPAGFDTLVTDFLAGHGLMPAAPLGV
ncbi:MAG: alpha/beta fold hydrolase [Gemmatimonas sp.]